MDRALVCHSFLWWQVFFEGTRQNILHIFRAFLIWFWAVQVQNSNLLVSKLEKSSLKTNWSCARILIESCSWGIQICVSKYLRVFFPSPNLALLSGTRKIVACCMKKQTNTYLINLDRDFCCLCSFHLTHNFIGTALEFNWFWIRVKLSSCKIGLLSTIHFVTKLSFKKMVPLNFT